MPYEEYALDQDSLEKQPARLRGALSFASKQVGGYSLGRVLGKGSCAVVRLGTHTSTGKKAAVKILKPKTIREQKEALREVDALQRLNHPNITRLHSVIRENTYTCLILELGAGGELFEHILNVGKLAEEDARRMFRQILSGLQYCHANLVAHRDLKPENLLLDDRGNIKISDFGLSNVLKPGKLFSTWCGSPVYTPPEVVLRQQYNGVAMDIWSLGVVLYVIVTGGMPWRLEANIVRNMDDLIKGDYDIPDFLNVSEDCKDLISMMLVADCSKRATLEAVMNHKWTCSGYAGAPDAHLEPKALVQNVNEDILLQLEALGYEPKKAREDITSNPTSPALTVYHLLVAKQHRSQKVNSCQVADANLVNSPSEYLRNSRIRSATHPVPLPTLVNASPNAPRKDPSCPELDLGRMAKIATAKKPGLLRSFMNHFKRVPQKHSEPITMIVAHNSLNVMVHNSPSPPVRRRM